ncbi:citryl-CoA lyase [Aquincola sp. S2]|uniref:Citryl-CoA lyase n=1 Tax=Pseudaquabacterium terrae TaxID=2732868 RepID=A0ABX2EN54_9BURK|nr:citryl-CoA lyase [Aquabacterium terrae]NRF70004.1 citryl-CoA lyase [Aquabacterium terrae]
MSASRRSLHDGVGRLRTRMGAAFVGQRAVFRGHDLHADLKDADWVDLYVFGITGRRHTAKQLKLLHAIWVYTSYPDARIWNNRVAALAGTTRSSGNLGASAALAVSEASIYGRGIDIRAARFLTGTLNRMRDGTSLADCVRVELDRHRGLAGYGRPIAAGDERLEPTLALAHRLGLDGGPHLQLAKDVEQFLLDGRWRWRMNYAALSAALTADLGFTPREHYLFGFPAFLAGMQPCFIEACEQPAGTLFPIPCSHVAYEGAARRPWPPKSSRHEP